jgi:hypothetical protein
MPTSSVGVATRHSLCMAAPLDAGQVADEEDGLAGVLIVAASEPMAVQHV